MCFGGRRRWGALEARKGKPMGRLPLQARPGGLDRLRCLSKPLPRRRPRPSAPRLPPVALASRPTGPVRHRTDTVCLAVELALSVIHCLPRREVSTECCRSW